MEAATLQAPATPAAPTIAAAAAVIPPAIGQPWPGVDGIYAGVSRGEDGHPDAHLVLLNARPSGELNWKDAVAWAAGVGEDTHLPTRFESALLYAHLRDQLDTDYWHWTSTQFSAAYAWTQLFYTGSQYYDIKSYEARARAVRRFTA